MAVPKPAGAWTYEDLFELPDDGKRYEIIDGELYELPSPDWDHQSIAAALFLLLTPEAKKIGALLRFAPLDVLLTEDRRRVVQPDLLLIARESQGIRRGRTVEGAPDLLIEILSPSDPGHDLSVKRRLYAQSGVCEYWVVDPVTQTIEVLALKGGAYITHVRASGDQLVTSTILPELSFPASAAFE